MENLVPGCAAKAPPLHRVIFPWTERIGGVGNACKLSSQMRGRERAVACTEAAEEMELFI